jgi:hypothetical protein
MPQLQRLDLNGSLSGMVSNSSHFTTETKMDDEGFMAVADALSSLSNLRMLHLHGFRRSPFLFL